MAHFKRSLQAVRFQLSGGHRLDGCVDEHAARAFHLLLTTILAWIALLAIVIVPFFSVRKVAGEGLILVLGSAAAIALAWVRRGRKRKAAALFLTVVWCAFACFSLLNGGVHSPAFALAIAVVLGAAWLLGRSAAFGFAAASLLLNLVEVLLEQTGYKWPVYFPGAPVSIWGIQLGTMLLAVGPALAFVESTRRQIADLRESEERYKALFDRSLDCVFLVDFEGRFLDANQATVHLLEVPLEDLLPQTFESFLAEDERSVARQRMETIIAEGHLQDRSEYRLLRNDGAEIIVEIGSSLIYRNGRPFAIQCIARDITGRIRAEEEKSRLQTQLFHAEKMESIGRLAAGVAHDSNNLLTVINGFADLAMARLPVGGVVWEFVREVRSAGQRAVRLTARLLAFSRNQISKPAKLQLNDEIRGLEAMLRHLLPDDMTLVLELADGLPPVEFDADQFGRILLNLSVNARQAMSAGGILTIRTNLQTEQDRIRLEVVDTGSGMTEAVKARVFEPFFTTKATGTGLGLSIVYGAVAHAGGTLEVDSAVGAGTTVRILLPVTHDEKKLGSATREDSRRDRSPGTILLVDEDANVRRIARRALQERGYAVHDAGDAVAIKAQLALDPALRPDLLIAPAPGAAGRHFAAELSKKFTALKVLFLTGDETEIRPALNSASDYLAKPYSVDALLHKVTQILQEADGPSKTILVADDDPSVRIYLRRLLTAEGHNVLEAKDGDEVRRLIAAQPIDILITDLVMPGDESLSFVQDVRAQQPAVRVIVISGMIGAEMVNLAAELGVYATLAKPLSPGRVLESVRFSTVA